MSIVTKIKTKKRLDLDKEVFDVLVESGYRIAIKDYDDLCQIYMPFISSRLTEISEEKYGYDVRITTLACPQDFKLYRDVIQILAQTTQGKIISEEGDIITNPLDFFDDKYIKERTENDFRCISTLIPQVSEIVSIVCPFREFVIGKNILAKIHNHSKNIESQLDCLYTMIRKSQYLDIGNDVSDSPVFGIKNNDDSDEEDGRRTITFYEKNKYTYISNAKFFAIQNGDNFLTVSFDDLSQIVPDSWLLIDEKQYKTAPLSDNEWEQMLAKMRLFNTDEL